MITMKQGGKLATLGDARSILTRGTDYFGLEEVMAVHGKLHELSPPKELPPIPFTNDELAEAHARSEGAHLMLVSPGLTMQALSEKRENKATDGGKILYQVDWYAKESFYTTETTGKKWYWQLTTERVVPQSLGQNYLGRSQALARYLKTQVYKSGDVPLAVAQAIAELEAQAGELEQLMSSANWAQAAKRLAALAINRLFCESPVVTLYRLITFEAINHERLLQNCWTWSAALSSNGRLVYVGRFGHDGASVDYGSPRNCYDNLGAVLSRRGEVEREG